MDEMTISLIIPTYNAGNDLSKLLESLEKQSMAFELIIIDSSSVDNSVQIAKKYTDKVIIIPQDSFDHGGARAQAAKMSTGEILVFLTQDALPVDSYAIENLVNVFSDGNIAAAYGRQISYEKTHLFGKHLRLFNYPETSYRRNFDDKIDYGIKTAFLSNSFAAYRKQSLKEIGWFKNGLILGEDMLAGARLLMAGHALAYVAEAKVYHSHSYSIAQEFKRYFDIGVFHHDASWLLDEFGKPEGEGKRYLLCEFSYILKQKAFALIFVFFIRNGMKYLGYTLGKNYKKLPVPLVKKLSMHPRWWHNKKLLDTEDIF